MGEFRGQVNLTTTLIIINLITVAVCIVTASLYCSFIGGGIVVLKRYHNKILRGEGNTGVKEKNDTQITVKSDIALVEKVPLLPKNEKGVKVV